MFMILKEEYNYTYTTKGASNPFCYLFYLIFILDFQTPCPLR